MNDTSTTTIDALEQALLTATDRIRLDVLLLGGGVDSALLAAMWKRHDHEFRAITVGRDASLTCVPAHEYLPYTCNSDLEWSAEVAKHLQLDWTPIALDKRESLRYLDMLPEGDPRDQFHRQYLAAQLTEEAGLVQLAQQQYRMLFRMGLQMMVADWEPSLLEQLEQKFTAEQ